MNVLVVSSYPPMACGIGAYAGQQVEALRGQGSAVDVLSPEEGDGDMHADLRGGVKPLRLAKYLWAYDEAYIHYTPAFFFDPDSGASRLCTSLAFFLLGLIFGRRIRFVIHETDYNVDDPNAGSGRRGWLDRWTWRLMGKVIFHSERERECFARIHGFKANARKLEVVDHGRDFVSRTAQDRAGARARLDIPGDALLFLSIGFVQPHKGFDRPIEAMKTVTSAKAMMRVVGSVRIDWQPALDFAEALHRAAAQDDRCEFVEQFVSDELFDEWIVAADYVIAPYREIWSSSVVARAALHGRPVIASNSGGMAEQLPEGSHTFETDEQLGENMQRIAETHAVSAAGARAGASAPSQ